VAVLNFPLKFNECDTETGSKDPAGSPVNPSDCRTFAPTDSIRIERGAEVGPGVWEYSIPSLGLCGKSRQPLLDSCRQIKSILGDTTHRTAGVFREGRDVPDISCPVEAGALITVSETSKERPRFVKYREFDWVSLRAEED
jgi:hypothetical protein